MAGINKPMNINIESYENYILRSTGTKDISIRSKIPCDDFQIVSSIWHIGS
jgi:hypothetical protein